MVLTDRDLQIIALLFKHRYLSTPQINKVFFKSNRSCQARMKVLYDEEYVDRYRPYSWKEGKKPYVFYLKTKGYRAIGEKPQKRRVNQSYLDHHLEVNDYILSNNFDDYGIEPQIGDYKPDAYGIKQGHKFYIEVDLGSESERKIIRKIEAYEKNFKEQFAVIFVAKKDSRLKTLETWVNRNKKKNIQYLFRRL